MTSDEGQGRIPNTAVRPTSFVARHSSFGFHRSIPPRPLSCPATDNDRGGTLWDKVCGRGLPPRCWPRPDRLPAGARASIFSHLFEHAAKHVAKSAVTNAVNNVNRRAAMPASKRNSPQTTYWSDYTRYRKPTGPNAAALRRLPPRSGCRCTAVAETVKRKPHPVEPDEAVRTTLPICITGGSLHLL